MGAAALPMGVFAAARLARLAPSLLGSLTGTTQRRVGTVALPT